MSTIRQLGVMFNFTIDLLYKFNVLLFNHQILHDVIVKLTHTLFLFYYWSAISHMIRMITLGVFSLVKRNLQKLLNVQYT